MLVNIGRPGTKEFFAVTSENNNNNIVEMKCLAYLVQCNLYCFSFNTKERIFFSIYLRVEGRAGESERSSRFIWNGKHNRAGECSRNNDIKLQFTEAHKNSTSEEKVHRRKRLLYYVT